VSIFGSAVMRLSGWGVWLIAFGPKLIVWSNSFFSPKSSSEKLKPCAFGISFYKLFFFKKKPNFTEHFYSEQLIQISNSISQQLVANS